MQSCQFCGSPAPLIHVHGHYQCSACGTNALPCCDGDNCDTNLQLSPDVIAFDARWPKAADLSNEAQSQ